MSIEGAPEAAAIARGEQPAASIFYLGHTYVPEARVVDLERQLAEARQTLEEARLQITYLHEKFRETGSGNAVLSRINAALTPRGGDE